MSQNINRYKTDLREIEFALFEFAKMKKDEGMETEKAALEGAKLRFRPILMTSFAFILGVIPLLTASGAGAEGRN